MKIDFNKIDSGEFTVEDEDLYVDWYLWNVPIKGDTKDKLIFDKLSMKNMVIYSRNSKTLVIKHCREIYYSPIKLSDKLSDEIMLSNYNSSDSPLIWIQDFRQWLLIDTSNEGILKLLDKVPTV